MLNLPRNERTRDCISADRHAQRRKKPDKSWNESGKKGTSSSQTIRPTGWISHFFWYEIASNRKDAQVGTEPSKKTN